MIEDINLLKQKLKSLQINGDRIKKKMEDNVSELTYLVQQPCTPQREIKFKMIMDETRKLGDQLSNITNEIIQTKNIIKGLE